MPAMEQTHTLREAIRTLGLPYVVGIMSSVSVWKPGEAPLSKTEVEGTGTPHQAVATTQPPSAASGQRPGAQSAGFGLEDRDLAARGKTKSSFALRCRTRSARASRLLAKRAASGRVAVDGMAPRGGRTNQILAVYASGGHDPEKPGPISQTAL